MKNEAEQDTGITFKSLILSPLARAVTSITSVAVQTQGTAGAAHTRSELFAVNLSSDDVLLGASPVPSASQSMHRTRQRAPMG